MNTCEYTPPVLEMEEEENSGVETVDMAKVYLMEHMEKAGNDPKKMALLSAELYEEAYEMAQSRCNDRDLMAAMEDEASRLGFCAATMENENHYKNKKVN